MRDRERCLALGPVQHLHRAVVMLDQARTMLDPVPVVDIDDAILVANAAIVDMTADMAVVALRARTRCDARFEIFDKATRGADALLDCNRNRSVGEAEVAAQRVA